MKQILLCIPLIICILLLSCSSDKSPTGNSFEKIPIADCGPDRTVVAGELVLADASASKPVTGEITNYIWERDENNPIIVQYRNDDNPAHFYFGFQEPGTYRFYLTVADETERSERDTLNVTVLPRTNVMFEDTRFEIDVRFNTKFCNGDFTDDVLATVDSLSAFSPITPYKISSLEGIEKCVNLRCLNLTNQELLTDLTPLASVNSLENLYIYNNPNLTDLSPLSNLKNLKYLTLYSCTSLTSVEPLAGVTSLVYLNLLNCQNIINYRYLSELVNLEELYITHMHNYMKGDISFISKMIELKKLTLTNSAISNITPIVDLTNLEELDLSKNRLINSLQSLVNCKKIKYLSLYQNQILDLTPIEGLTLIKTALLHANKFSSIKSLFDNHGVGDGDSLSITIGELDSLSLNVYLPELKSRGVIIQEY